MRRTRRLLVALSLGLVLVGSTATAKDVEKTDKSTTANVGLQIVLARANTKLGEAVHASAVITNASSQTIQSPGLLLFPKSAGFTLKVTPQPLVSIPPYGAEYCDVEVTVDRNAEFGNHHLLFVLQYGWQQDSIARTSAVAVPADLQVERQFEEEAKGLPGGTAALLYLILPVMTIFLAYEVIDSLCRGKGLRWPEFKGEYVLPAFLVAILMNFLLVFEFHQDQSLLYATPRKLGLFLLAMAAIGVVIPVLLLIGRWFLWSRYGFTESEKAHEYLGKVLAKFPDGVVQWVTGTADGQWSGVLLPEPDKTYALGAQLHVTTNPKPRVGDPDFAALKKIVTEDGRILQAKKLVSLIKNGKVLVQIRSPILQDGTKLTTYVERERVKNFVATNRSEMPVIASLK